MASKHDRLLNQLRDDLNGVASVKLEAHDANRIVFSLWNNSGQNEKACREAILSLGGEKPSTKIKDFKSYGLKFLEKLSTNIDKSTSQKQMFFPFIKWREDKVMFRGKLIDVDKVKTYLEWSSSPSTATLINLAKKMTEYEEDIAIAIVVEQQLKTIAAGINLAKYFETDKISSALSLACHSAGSEQQMLLPLFFNDDLSESASHYITDVELRNTSFNEFMKLIKNDQRTLAELKKTYLNFFYKSYCYFPISDDFEEFCSTPQVVEIIQRTISRKKAIEKYKDIFGGLFLGLLLGGFFGPLAYLHVNMDSGSTQSDEIKRKDLRQRPYANYGVTFWTAIWLLVIYLSVNSV